MEQCEGKAILLWFNLLWGLNPFRFPGDGGQRGGQTVLGLNPVLFQPVVLFRPCRLFKFQSEVERFQEVRVNDLSFSDP